MHLKEYGYIVSFTMYQCLAKLCVEIDVVLLFLSRSLEVWSVGGKMRVPGNEVGHAYRARSLLFSTPSMASRAAP